MLGVDPEPGSLLRFLHVEAARGVPQLVCTLIALGLANCDASE